MQITRQDPKFPVKQFPWTGRLSVVGSAELRGLDTTEQVFANRIGVTHNYFTAMEHGKVQIEAEILLRISENYGKSVE